VRYHAGHGVVSADAENVVRFAGEQRVRASALDKTVEKALLTLKVASLQPRALTAVELDQGSVLNIERGPDSLPGDQKHMIIDPEIRVVSLLEERLPQHAGTQTVGIEDQLHWHTLTGPAAAGLPPQMDRLVLGFSQSRHGENAAPNVFPGVGAKISA
jgi:hypothetical protein